MEERDFCANILCLRRARCCWSPYRERLLSKTWWELSDNICLATFYWKYDVTEKDLI
ncbi:MAG: hypothetical protein OCU20_08670 [Methanophagales archaeon]|nr:hypothetical protein [Methanophagales archaeon]